MSSKAQNPCVARKAFCPRTWPSPQENPRDCPATQFKSTPPIFPRKPNQSADLQDTTLQLTGRQWSRIKFPWEAGRIAKKRDSPTGSAPSGKRQCVIFTVPDGGNDRARPQKIEQKGQERISRLAARNGRALRSRRYHGDQAHGRHCAGRGRRGNRPSTLVLGGADRHPR